LCRINTAPFQLEGIKPTFLHGRQSFGRNLNLAAYISLGYGDVVDAFELGNATSVLAAKPLNLCFAFDPADHNDHRTTGLEGSVLFEQLLDSDLSAKSLRFRDPRDGNIGGF
jgi:hypothetical protein